MKHTSIKNAKFDNDVIAKTSIVCNLPKSRHIEEIEKGEYNKKKYNKAINMGL